MDQINVNVSQFYYNGALGDLVIGRAKNVVSNGLRKSLPQGTLVLNYGRQSDQFYCQVGVSLGSVNDQKSNDIWMDWGKSNPVFDVNWVTDLINVPADYFKDQAQNLPNTAVLDVIMYCLIK